MFESITGPKKNLSEQYADFDSLSEDNWHGILEAGLPLYSKLLDADDERATTVRNRLTYLRSTLQNSGAGAEQERLRMIQRISEVID